jgi:SnoaL-like domain
MEQKSGNKVQSKASEERQVQNVLARYTRAADQLNGKAVSDLFVPDGKVEVYYVNGGNRELLFVLSGQAEIENAISNLMKPHPARGWSHHTTHDHIIEVNGDHATIDAQFIRFDSVGEIRPDNGWPEGTLGLMGNVTPTESGYYQPTLQKISGEWKIVTHVILHDLTFAIPGK